MLFCLIRFGLLMLSDDLIVLVFHKRFRSVVLCGLLCRHLSMLAISLFLGCHHSLVFLFFRILFLSFGLLAVLLSYRLIVPLRFVFFLLCPFFGSLLLCFHFCLVLL